MKEKRDLSVGFEGFISLSELEELRDGSILASNLFAWSSFHLYFNGVAFGRGELLSIPTSNVGEGEELIGVKVTSLAYGDPSGPFPEHLSYFPEIIEYRVQIASCRPSLQEIIGIGTGTIMELDNSTLHAANIHVLNINIGQGQLVTVDDRIAIRVTSLSKEQFVVIRDIALHRPIAMRSSGSVVADPSQRQISDYDLKVPQKLTGSRLRGFHTIHHTFAKKLAAIEPSLAGVAFRIYNEVPSDRFVGRLSESKPLVAELSISWLTNDATAHTLYLMCDPELAVVIVFDESLIRRAIIPSLMETWGSFLEVNIDLVNMKADDPDLFSTTERIAEARCLVTGNAGISVLYPYATLVALEKYLEQIQQ